MTRLFSLHSPARLCALLYLAALLLSAQQLTQLLPLNQWTGTLTHAFAQPSPRQIVIQDMWLPRQLMALLCGMALALVGVVMQQALRNPLAEPMTLGVASGATLALTLTALMAPAWLMIGREWLALGGSVIALLTVFVLASRQAFSPLALILAGMLVNLYCGSVTLLMSIIYDQSLAAIFIWGGGSLVQQDSHAFWWLLPRVLFCLIPILLMLRPLSLMSLNEQVTRSLGISPGFVRSVVLLAALAISSLVISQAGVIGFIGLAAPHLAALAGAHRLRQRILWSPLVGGGLLWLTDQGVSRLTGYHGLLLPTGMMTALAGGPLLLWYLPRVRSVPVQAIKDSLHAATATVAKPRTLWVFILLLAGIFFSLDVGRSLNGWHFSGWPEFLQLMPYRLPRMVAGLTAGVLLAGAGVLIQRVTANPMASPELLGIGAGASLGITVLLLIQPAAGMGGIMLSSAAGAFITLMITALSFRQGRFHPQRALLCGLAITAIFQSVAGVVMSNNGIAANMLRQLMTGSTYYVTTPMAAAGLLLAVFLLALTPLLRRHLQLLPLESVPFSLGMRVPRARSGVMVLAAAMTGVATLIVGPLSFIGLLGPHIARQLGARRPMLQLLLAVMISALLMVVADWLGRNMLYPRQIPAGLMATLTGGPWLAVLLYRQQHRG
ncbi:Fe(3+)-hydroxamate ABC transporter permease FhuB [Rahnella sp. AA]|uniref:Fe(3+)-hydroxamate ABC transporter permease FhuB n=1 Tax=Rahnella sp. AA TaxID=2057180 RepID=UPI000C332F85|nr:Fe(3+)-hydroxamate ABC transporter permease FhuB [Rahnella sp. AA]PKE31440.1 Fe(3+)-hydroxamate ABC transporter permease FhuB [Rahnella sp. AA]